MQCGGVHDGEVSDHDLLEALLHWLNTVYIEEEEGEEREEESEQAQAPPNDDGEEASEEISDGLLETSLPLSVNRSFPVALLEKAEEAVPGGLREGGRGIS